MPLARFGAYWNIFWNVGGPEINLKSYLSSTVKDWEMKSATATFDHRWASIIKTATTLGKESWCLMSLYKVNTLVCLT